MFSLIAGILLIAFGVCLVGDIGKTATRIHAFFTSFMNPGYATTGTIRLGGVFAALVGAGWVVTSFPLG
ncbi:hypothetical protein [Streptomyces triticisoli]|uniref:hypothetical protein n=1 Tax=Streptomyces triticisoli TaxID=2182797 RepID=UPI000DD6FA5B|nr:hypothetical protein [Streptomyces triticisoli]